MRPRSWNSWTAVTCLVAGIALIGGPQRAAAMPDWKAVEQALGKAGELQPGGVYRVGFPRTDLAVTVHGVLVEPAFALGSYAAFKAAGDQAMVMGDLVLRDEEIAPVMSRLLGGGLHVTALHNHLTAMSPHVMYLHYAGHGDAARLASALRNALSASGTPLGGGQPAGPAGAPALDSQQIQTILGHPGKLLNPRVFQVSVVRAERISEGGEELPPAMGVGMPLNFQATGDGRAAVTGDLVLVGREVEPVVRALLAHGIEVTALHNHALGDEPRLFYVHFWAHGDALDLARGLRAALDQTNSRKGA